MENRSLATGPKLRVAKSQASLNLAEDHADLRRGFPTNSGMLLTRDSVSLVLKVEGFLKFLKAY